MSLNLISFAIPIYNIFNVLTISSPKLYKQFEEMPQSHHTAAVNEIAARVLNAENIAGAEYIERVDDMLKNLPDSAGPKTIPSLLQYRFKVVEMGEGLYPVFQTGNDAQDGKYYIGVKSDFQIEQGLPWVITHELSHILNDDALNLKVVQTISTLAATVISTFVLGWSWPLTLSAVMLTHFVSGAIYSHVSERNADDFAIKHCTVEALKNGIGLLERFKAYGNRTYVKSVLNKVATAIYYPSNDARIAKIQKAIELSNGRTKTA